MIKFYPSSPTYRYFVYLLLMGLPFLVQGQESSDISNQRSDPNLFPRGQTINQLAVITTTIWNGTSWSSGLPDESQHAVINGYYNNSGFTCMDLTINSGFAFHPSSDVFSLGNVKSNSTLITGRVVMNSPDVSQTVEGTFSNLSIENPFGVVLSAPVRMRGTLKLNLGVLNTNGKSLTLNSNSSGTARISKIESGAGIVGNVTIERFVPGGTKGWHFMAPAVIGQNQSDWVDNFAMQPNSVFLHNEGGTLNLDDQINGWEYPPGAPNANLTLGRGYRVFLNQNFFNGSATFDNTGPIKTGNHSFNVSFSPAGYGGGGWNLIANPYPCEIDWHSFSKTAIGGQVHLWNQSQYASYSEGAGIGVNGGTRYIPSSQGFFVRSSSANPALSITEDAKPENPMTTNYFKISTDPEDVARITLRKTGGEKDETAIRWMPQSTVNFDNFYDADKLPNDVLSVYSMTNDGRRTSIQVRPYLDGDPIDIGYGVKEEGNYTLQIHLGNDVVDGKTWFLKDNEFGSIYTLTQDYSLNFQVVGGVLQSNWRFSLIGTNNVVSTTTSLSAKGLIVFPNPSTEMVSIGNAANVKMIVVSDLTGKDLFSIQNSGLNTLQIPTSKLVSGVYFLNVQTETGFERTKFVKE